MTTTAMSHYQPHPIESESYRIIERLVDLSAYPPEQQKIFHRVIHTTGDPSFIDGFYFSTNAIASGVQAIRNKPRVVTDVTMVQTGLKRSLLTHFGIEPVCHIHDEAIHRMAEKEGTTRATASIRWLCENQTDDPLILVIGDAPTALLEVVEKVSQNELKVNLVIGIPVGFVGTEASKQALQNQSSVPCITNTGTRGGSPVAAAIFNALMILADQSDVPVS